jgi:hypothetical protein
MERKCWFLTTGRGDKLAANPFVAKHLQHVEPDEKVSGRETYNKTYDPANRLSDDQRRFDTLVS